MNHPTLALAMIVRNGSAGLARCLRSALPAVDSIVIGDTGSTDNSVQIARELGAQVFSLPWENDFSKARNVVLAQVKTDWVLWMDDDEMLDPGGASSIPVLLEENERAEGRVDAFEVWRWNYVNSLNSRSGGLMAEPNPFRLAEAVIYPAYTRYLNTLLFRRLPGLYFENPVHETVSRRVRALGLRAVEAPFVIHHFGFVEGPESARKQKNEYYYQLGLEKVRHNPDDHWAQYEMGLCELEHRKNPAAALACLDIALALNPENQNARVYAGICLTRLGRAPEALDSLQHAWTQGVRTALLTEALGDACFQQQETARAAQWYGQVEKFQPAGRAGVSALVECKLGACQVRLGETGAGLARIEAAVKREPLAGELYEIWAAAAVQAGDVATACAVAKQRLTVGQAPASSYVITAVLEAHLGHWKNALTTLVEGQSVYPEDPVLQREARAVREKMGEQ
jgi:tetratricopeptide (TPR) repeat protein